MEDNLDINSNKRISHAKRIYLLIAFLLIGVCIRTPFTSVDPIFSMIAKGMHTSVSSLGFLTTLPLIMFAICSFIIPSISRHVSLETIFTWVLALMTIGSIARIFGLFWLYAGTCLIGIAVAFLNVLMPAAVNKYFPNQIGKYTAIYISSMMITMSVASAVVVPISKKVSWTGYIIIISIITFLSFIYMIPSLFVKTLKDPKVSEEKVTNNEKTKSAWTNPRAWVMLIFIGVQSAIFYIYLTWLPTMMIDDGVSPYAAGIFSGAYTLLGLPFSVFLPGVLTKISKKARLWTMLVLSIMTIVGTVMLFVRTSNIIYWCVIIFFLGCATGSLYPYFMTILPLKTSNATASAEVSGMSQTGGYFIAAVGPALFGYCFNIFHVPSFIAVVILGIIMTICIIYIEKSDIIM